MPLLEDELPFEDLPLGGPAGDLKLVTTATSSLSWVSNVGAVAVTLGGVLAVIPVVGPLLKGLADLVAKAAAPVIAEHGLSLYNHHEEGMTRGVRGLRAGQVITGAMPRLLAQHLHDALHFLWTEALPARIHHFLRPVLDTAEKALARATSALKHAEENLAKAKYYTDQQVKAHGGLTRPEVEHIVHEEGAKIEHDDAKRLEQYKQRQAEQIRGQVHGLPSGLTSVGALLAAIAVESGLGEEGCRTKVKDICGVNPANWAGLLASLAALGFAFNLDALVKAAKSVEEPVVSLLRQAA